MSNQKQQFLTPVGRLVQGNPLEKQTKDQQGNALIIKSGPQAGQPTQRYFAAVAFSKTQCPEFAQLWATMQAEARKSFPQLFDVAGNCTHPQFSWKLADGDGRDQNGQANSGKEGFAGHWVLRFQSSFPPRVYYAGRYAAHEALTDPKLIPRGWYVRVSGTMEGNGNAQKPGLYMNLGMLEIVAQGPEIVSGPDGAAVFGGAPAAALPAGATALPSVGAPAGVAMPGMPAPGTMAPTHVAPPVAPVMPGAQPAIPGLPGMPAAAAPAVPQMPGAAPVAPPVAPVAVNPNPAFVNGPAPAGVPGMVAPPPVAPVAPVAPPAAPQIQATATWPAGQTWQSMTAAGWNEQSMRQAGYIV